MNLAPDLVRRMVAELIGTFILVFCGTGAIIASIESGGEIGPLAYIFGFGFALIFIVYAIGHISGAHVNPAVTLGLGLSGRFPMAEVPYYWGSQVVGAVLASFILRLIYGNAGNLGMTQVNPEFSVINGFVLEMILTAILVFVVHAAATDDRAPAAATGLAIGGTLLVIHVVGGSVTGGSVNPARSLAPALLSNTYADLWIYLVAPFIGAAIGALGYEFIRGRDSSAISTREGETAESRRGQPRRGRGDPADRAGRGERPSRSERPERGERRQRARPEHTDHGDPVDRPGRHARPRVEWEDVPTEPTERPQRMERPDRAPRTERADRLERPNRADRPPRPERVERPERPARATRATERPVEPVEEFDDFEVDEFGDPLPPPAPPQNPR